MQITRNTPRSIFRDQLNLKRIIGVYWREPPIDVYVLMMFYRVSPPATAAAWNSFVAMLLLLLPMVFDGSAHASARQLNFGALEIPPYATQGENGELRGLMVDILQAYADQSEQALQLAAYPAARLVKHMRQGDVDCTIYIRSAATEDIAEPVVYLGVDFKTAVIAKKATKLDGYDDLRDLRLAVTRGTVFGHKIDTDESLNRVITRDYGQSALMLARDRVDAILGIDWSLLHNIRVAGIPNHELGEPLILKSSELWLFCSRNADLTAEDKSVIRSGFTKLRRAGAIERIVTRYKR